MIVKNFYLAIIYIFKSNILVNDKIFATCKKIKVNEDINRNTCAKKDSKSILDVSMSEIV